jgi:hypothetical protein
MIMVAKAVQSDAGAIREILEPVLRAGDVYLLPSDWTCQEALGYWFPNPVSSIST